MHERACRAGPKTDFFVRLVRKEEIVAGKGERRDVPEPFPPDRHGSRKPGIESRDDPGCAVTGEIRYDQSLRFVYHEPIRVSDPRSPVKVARVESRERFGRLQSEQDVAMSDRIEEGAGREDDLPRGVLPREESVQFPEPEDPGSA